MTGDQGTGEARGPQRGVPGKASGPGQDLTPGGGPLAQRKARVHGPELSSSSRRKTAILLQIGTDGATGSGSARGDPDSGNRDARFRR